jgi:hypothetical protein
MWRAGLAGLAMLAAVGSARADDPVTVPFLAEAPEVYATAFLTAVRGYPTLGVSGLMQDVETCYANIRPNERVQRLQYCFFLHATVRMLEAAIPAKKVKLSSPDVPGDVRERAVFMLAQDGYKPSEIEVILRAWSTTGQDSLRRDQFMEFRRLSLGR